MGVRCVAALCGAWGVAAGTACDSGSESTLQRYSGDEVVEATVDERGAELQLGGDLQLRVPEGALREAVDVKVTRAEANELRADETEARVLSDRVRLEPHDLRFERDVEIELRVKESDVKRDDVEMLKLESDDDTDWERVRDVRVVEAEDSESLRDLSREERELRGAMRMVATTRRFGVYAVMVHEDDADAAVDVADAGPVDARDAGDLEPKDAGPVSVDAGSNRTRDAGGGDDAGEDVGDGEEDREDAGETGEDDAGLECGSLEYCPGSFGDSGECVDTQTDRRHCGGCAPDPAAGRGPDCYYDSDHSQACVTGCTSAEECNTLAECEDYDFGNTACDVGGDAIICVDLTRNSSHCGDCSTSCAPEEECSDGTCVARTCPEGERPCGYWCRDENLSCGAMCSVEADCVSGECVVLE